MIQDKIRVGIVGAGTWADSAHIPGWNRDARCEVVVVCDVDNTIAHLMASKHGVSEWSDDWQSVISRTDIDVIDIVTPSHTHLELATAAIETSENQCTHKDSVTNVGPQSQVCVQCDAQGLEYPDVRFCTVCGFTGCCDGAKGAHMIEHSNSTGHPVIKAVNPNEDWLWCYPDEAYVEL